MAINYDAHLTVEQKKAIVENRLQQFASEAYQTELNQEIQKRTGNKEIADGYDETLAVIATAIVVHEEELVKLESQTCFRPVFEQKKRPNRAHPEGCALLAFML